MRKEKAASLAAITKKEKARHQPNLQWWERGRRARCATPDLSYARLDYYREEREKKSERDR